MAYNIDTYNGPSFSLRNRLGRLVWSIVYVLFFRLSPTPFHAWRSFLLKMFGAKVGKGVHVYPGVSIWAPWNVEFGDECGVASGVKIYSQAKITIGKRTVISQGVNLCAGTHDYTKEGFPLIRKPIFIKDYAWIAADAFVHPGIMVGEGCVIGARSVVTKNMPPWMICAGHPCQPIKERIMEKPLKSKHI